MIDRNKVVFITVDWMKHYQGITATDQPLGTGGSYPKDKKHEVFNFLDNDGFCYGYTPPYGNINLKAINNKEIQKDFNGAQYIENVLIIFNASKPDGQKRRIVGFYVNATIFKSSFSSSNPKRIFHSDNSFAGYNIKVKAENAYLFEEEERNILLPFSKRDGYGYGQSNIWYARDDKSQPFKDSIVKLIQKIIEETTSKDDEIKYFEGETNTTVKTINTAKRNASARAKCLQYYFPNKKYKCILCGFDFEKGYGDLGKDFIEVHHKESHTLVSKISGTHEINPIEDLIPVCSNCHSIIHRSKPPIPVEKIKEILQK
jgi:5-methylcytosine-specific restriction protein A